MELFLLLFIFASRANMRLVVAFVCATYVEGGALWEMKVAVAQHKLKVACVQLEGCF